MNIAKIIFLCATMISFMPLIKANQLFITIPVILIITNLLSNTRYVNRINLYFSIIWSSMFILLNYSPHITIFISLFIIIPSAYMVRKVDA